MLGGHEIFVRQGMDMDVDDTRGSTNASKVEEAEGNLRDWEDEIETLDGPPDGFLFILPFLDLRSRMTMEIVSKSLRDAVRNNPLVWQHLHVERPALHVERPAFRNLTNDILKTLVRRAHGQLKSLSLIQSYRISEESLGWILAANPGLEQLSIPKCIYVTSEGVVNLVERHTLEARSKGLPGLKQVQIRGLYNITKGHLDRLHQALGLVGRGQGSPNHALIPRYYGSGVNNVLRRNDDGAPIDVEVCPLCANVRMVYDCTMHKDPTCKGCTFCIPRCEECGVCIRDMSHEVSLCSDLVCEACWFGLLKCSECNRAVCGRHADQYIDLGRKSFTCKDCIFAQENPDPDESIFAEIGAL